MGLRELKETAHQQFVRGKFSQCAQTYQQVLRLAPRDPNMYVRHAEASRRAGEKQQAIASYQTAAELLLEIGCESRARGALRAALELNPADQFLQEVVTRLEAQYEESSSSTASEGRDELPLLPPLESGLDPLPPPPPAPRIHRAASSEEPGRAAALPPVHRGVPAAQARSQTPLPLPRLTAAPLPPRSVTAGTPVPSAQPSASLPPRSVTASTRAQAARPAAPPILTPLPVTSGVQAAASAAPAASSRGFSPGAVVPPPPPAEALIEAACGIPLAELTARPAVRNPLSSSVPRLEVRRLSPTTLAFRSSPHDGWAVIRSHTPLELHVVEDLEKFPPMMRDLPAELTVASDAKASSSIVH